MVLGPYSDTHSRSNGYLQIGGFKGILRFTLGFPGSHLDSLEVPGAHSVTLGVEPLHLD